MPQVWLVTSAPIAQARTLGTILPASESEAAGSPGSSREMQKRHGLPKEEAHQIATRGLRSIMKSMHPAAERVTMKQAKVKGPVEKGVMKASTVHQELRVHAGC